MKLFDDFRGRPLTKEESDTVLKAVDLAVEELKELQYAIVTKQKDATKNDTIVFVSKALAQLKELSDAK